MDDLHATGDPLIDAPAGLALEDDDDRRSQVGGPNPLHELPGRLGPVPPPPRRSGADHDPASTRSTLKGRAPDSLGESERRDRST